MTSKSRLLGTVLALGLAGGAAGAIHDVSVINTQFVPAEITVVPGDTVRWTWQEGIHTVTSGTACTFDNLYFDEPMNSGNPVFSFVIPSGPSEIPYFCRPHCSLGMVGKITIETGGGSVPTASTAAWGALFVVILSVGVFAIARRRTVGAT